MDPMDPEERTDQMEQRAVKEQEAKMGKLGHLVKRENLEFLVYLDTLVELDKRVLVALQAHLAALA